MQLWWISAQAPLAPIIRLKNSENLEIWKPDSVEADKGPDQSCFSAEIHHKSCQDLNSFLWSIANNSFQNEVTCDPRLNPSKPALHPDVQVHTQFKIMTFLSIHTKFTKEPHSFYHCPVHLFMSCPLSMDCIEVPSHLYHQHLCHHWHRYCYAEQMPDALGIWRHLCITPSLP